MSRKHGHKIHENKENTCLESLIFMSIPERNRSFHFSRFIQTISNIASRGLRNWGLLVLFSSKTWLERGVKNTQKAITRKVRNNYEKVVKKDVPKSGFFFWFFWGLGPKAPQGGPKDPYKHPPMLNLIENSTKMVRIILFLWCFYRSCLRLGGKT